jgi:uncharacterized membrane protein YadS
MTYKEVYGDEVALKVAAVTKLTRNLFLAGVIPGLTYLHVKQEEAAQNVDSRGGDRGSAGSTPDGAPRSGGESSGSRGGSSGAPTTDGAMAGLATFQKYVPSFLFAFVGMAALRSVGDYTLADSSLAFYALDPVVYQTALKAIGDDASKVLLGTAMAAVGLSTSAEVMKGVGYKPFMVGGMGAIVVGGTGLLASSIVVASSSL